MSIRLRRPSAAKHQLAIGSLFVGCILINVTNFGKAGISPGQLFPPTICIIARTHNAVPEEMILAFFHSLRAQSYPHFEVWVVNSEKPSEAIFARTVQSMKDQRFRAKLFNIHLPSPRHHSFGYPVTEAAINSILAQTAPGHRYFKYILMTNSDNLYHHHFLSRAVVEFETRTPSPCIVGSNWISRYHQRLVRGVLGETDTVRVFEHRLYHMDLGAAVVKIGDIRSAFKEKVHFLRNSTIADYKFFDRVANERHGCVRRMPGILFIHQ